MTRPSPSSRDDWYAANYRGASEATITREHGGPETQKGGAHAPVSVLNPGGVRSAIGCTCGARPKKAPQNVNYTHTAYVAHVRSLGLPTIRNFSHTVYATGEGYPAEGLTWNEWYAFDQTADPFGERDR